VISDRTKAAIIMNGEKLAGIVRQLLRLAV
jgi:hypothetical protein